MAIQETRDQLTVKNAVVLNSEFDDVNLYNGRIAKSNLSNLAIGGYFYSGMTIDGIAVHDLMAAHRARQA